MFWIHLIICLETFNFVDFAVAPKVYNHLAILVLLLVFYCTMFISLLRRSQQINAAYLSSITIIFVGRCFIFLYVNLLLRNNHLLHTVIYSRWVYIVDIYSHCGKGTVFCFLSLTQPISVIICGI